MAINISNEVLSGLARPDFGRSMFQTGQALGGIGAQYRAKKTDDEFNALMAKASEAQKNNNDVALFNIAQQLRAMGRNQAASAVSATATKMKDTKRKGELASAVDVASQMARGGEAVPDYLLQDIQGLGGTEEVRNVRQLMREQDTQTQEGLLQQVLSSPNFDFESPKDVNDYFKGASQMEGVTPTRAREIFDEFKTGGKDPNVQRSIVLYFRDPVTGDTYTQVEMVMKDGSTQRGPITPDPGSKPYTGQNLVRTDQKDLRVQTDKPEMARREKLETDYAGHRVEASLRVDQLQQTSGLLQEAINLLATNEVRTGGVPRQMSKGLLRFIGSEKIPQSQGRLAGILSEAVMRRLQGFAGAISDGERNYAIQSIIDYVDNEEVNIGRLSVLLQNAENELQNSITMAKSPTYDDYRRAKGLVIESDFFGLPAEDRPDAMEAVKNGTYTYDQIMKAYQ
jgi:hypothetical protein